MVASEEPKSEPSVQAGSLNATLDQGGWLIGHKPLHFTGDSSTAPLPGPSSRVVPVQGCIVAANIKRLLLNLIGMPSLALSYKLQGYTQG